MNVHQASAQLWTTSPIPAATILRAWHPQSPGQLFALRRDVRSQLAARGESSTPALEEVTDRVVLVMDELASNGLRHGLPPVTVQLSIHHDGWLVVVTDAAVDRLPNPAVDRPAGQRGYGLYVIARLAIAHGIYRDSVVKSVWALLPWASARDLRT